MITTKLVLLTLISISGSQRMDEFENLQVQKLESVHRLISKYKQAVKSWLRLLFLT